MRACEEESIVTSSGALDPAKGTKRKDSLSSKNSQDALEEKNLSNVSKGADMNLIREQIEQCTVFSKNNVEVSKESNNSDDLCKTVEFDMAKRKKAKKRKKHSLSSKNSQDALEEKDLNVSKGTDMNLKREQIEQCNVFLKNNVEVSKESSLRTSLQTTEVVLNKKDEGHGDPFREESLALVSSVYENSNTALQESENYAEVRTQKKKKKKKRSKESSNVAKNSDPAEKLLEEQTGMKPLEEEIVDSLEGHGATIEESLTLEYLVNERSNTVLHESENHAETSTRQKKKKRSKKSTNAFKNGDAAQELPKEQINIKPPEEEFSVSLLKIFEVDLTMVKRNNEEAICSNLTPVVEMKHSGLSNSADADSAKQSTASPTVSPKVNSSSHGVKNIPSSLRIENINQKDKNCFASENNLETVKDLGWIMSLPAVQNVSMCGICPNSGEMVPSSRKVGGRIRKKVKQPVHEDKTLNDMSTFDLHEHPVQTNEDELNKVSKAVQRCGCEDENFEGSPAGCEKEETLLSSSTKDLTGVKSLDLINEVDNSFANCFDRDPASRKRNRRTILQDDSFNNVVSCDLPRHAVKKNENDLQEMEPAVQKGDSCREDNLEVSLINGIKDERMLSSSTGDAITDVASLDLINKEDNLVEMELTSLERASISCTPKKLLVLDLNGLLADIVFIVPDGYKADIKVGKKNVFKRPFCDDFLKFCFERFDIGIWSSRTKSNVNSVVDYLFGDIKHKLLFCWDSSRCTHTGFTTIENRYKPLVLKELNKLWNKDEPDLPWEKGEYSMSNTLLLDDSPYKALRNPPHTAIFPRPYTFKDTNDNSLGPGGDLRVYLEKLAMAEDLQLYVKEHPFGQRPITTENPSWNFYLQVINSSVPT